MSVIRDLQQTPEEFSFVQTLRVLEFHQRERQPAPTLSRRSSVSSGVDFRPPAREAVRIRGQHHLTFPGAEVEQLAQDKNGQWQLQANFIGLAGALGPLPFHYTELLQERQKAKDPALMQFLDLFNHRTASLFWRAASKYRLPLEYERARRESADPHRIDRHTEVLLSLLGLSPRLLQDRGALPAEALIYYGGLLSQQVKTAANLKQILRGYFQVPISIEQFSGTWCEVLPSMRTRLPCPEQPKGQNNCLGRTTLMGQKSWLAQNKVRIKIGPLNREQHRRFAPGSAQLESLNQLSALYLGVENHFDVTLQVKAAEMPKQLRLDRQGPPRLGWNSRLPESIYRPRPPEQTLNIPLSAQCLNKQRANATKTGNSELQGRSAA